MNYHNHEIDVWTHQNHYSLQVNIQLATNFIWEPEFI